MTPGCRRAGTARIVFATLCALTLCRARALSADAPIMPPVESPRPHAVGEVFNYTVHGTSSQAITGRDPFGASIRQSATPTDLQGRERVAIKAVTLHGLSLHRSGTIVATFGGKSSPAQRGTGWTLVTPQGFVADRKGSTLGGLFLLPLGFLGERAVNGGAQLQIGDRWTAKLGMALFGMAARPQLVFKVVGTRHVFGLTVYSLIASGSAPVKEPIVTNDDVALGYAMGKAYVKLQCDYDPLGMRMVSMSIDVADDLRITPSGRRSGGKVRDHQHYLVALDATSIEPSDPATRPPG
jgi:hypothetical protein